MYVFIVCVYILSYVQRIDCARQCSKKNEASTMLPIFRYTYQYYVHEYNSLSILCIDFFRHICTECSAKRAPVRNGERERKRMCTIVVRFVRMGWGAFWGGKSGASEQRTLRKHSILSAHATGALLSKLVGWMLLEGICTDQYRHRNSSQALLCQRMNYEFIEILHQLPH